MKILHIVSFVDPEGSFGGPLRVAINQLNSLKDAGHDVLMVGGAQGFAEAPDSYEGAPFRAFSTANILPGMGFAGTFSPSLLVWLTRHASEFDAVHVHLARDLVSLPAAFLLQAMRIPYVVQTHGMVDRSDKVLAKVLDAVATRRVLRRASTVLALTPKEVDDLAQVQGQLTNVEVLHNGVPDTGKRANAAQSQEVLFLARLAPRKRPVEFVRAAQEIVKHHDEATFVLVGPDEGELDAVNELIAKADGGGRIRYEGALPPGETIERMAQAGVYVLPADNEPFGMTLFEAMSVELPTVARNDCGIAPIVAETGGVVFGGEVGLVQAIDELLNDPARRQRAGQSGRRYVESRASMAGIRDSLLRLYGQLQGER